MSRYAPDPGLFVDPVYASPSHAAWAWAASQHNPVRSAVAEVVNAAYDANRAAREAKAASTLRDPRR